MSLFEKYYAGDTRRIKLTISDVINETIDGVYNLTNTTALTVAIAKSNDFTALLDKSYDIDDIMLGDPEDGTVLFTLMPTDTANISPGQCVMQVRLTESDGDEYTVLEHHFEMRGRIR